MSLRILLSLCLASSLMTGCATMPDPAPLPASHNILFDVDKAELRPESVAYLNGLAEFLKANTNYDIVLEGHTDNSAANDYNLALSERRAKAVQSHLVQRGVDISRTLVVSYGESRPIAPNQSATGKQENRRVSITTIERKSLPRTARISGVPKNEYNGTDPAIPGRDEKSVRATHR